MTPKKKKPLLCHGSTQNDSQYVSIHIKNIKKDIICDEKTDIFIILAPNVRKLERHRSEI